MKTTNKQNMSAWQVFLRASVIFAVFFVLLFSVFASAAKLVVPKKISKPNVAVGSIYKITVSKLVSTQLKSAEICRGKIKRTCKKVAKNIRGVKVSVPIPANYPIGDAAIKITYKDTNKKNVVVIDKAIKIVASSSKSGGGGGGGGGSSSSSSSSNSVDDLDFGDTNSTPTPKPSGTTPTPTPSASAYKDVKPVLVSH
jgi:uncharacterized membrane protein YgcG